MRVAHGTTRTTILFKRWAFKFPSIVEWRLFLHGLLANMQEAQFSKCGWSELCPVTFAIPGGFLTVMRRARILTREEWLALTDQQKQDLIEHPNYVIPAELKADSFGWLDGRIVAVDYG
jgi:hypothetical protein